MGLSGWWLNSIFCILLRTGLNIYWVWSKSFNENIKKKIKEPPNFCILSSFDIDFSISNELNILKTSVRAPDLIEIFWLYERWHLIFLFISFNWFQFELSLDSKVEYIPLVKAEFWKRDRDHDVFFTSRYHVRYHDLD